MVSFPAPAITLFIPSCSVMMSSSPLPRLIDSIRRWSPLAKKNARPSSPRIVLLPAPAVIWSAPAPPMTAFVPAVSSMISAAPEAKSVLAMFSRVPEFVSRIVPLSPSTIALAVGVFPATSIVSPAAPPMTIFRPAPTSISSTSPMFGFSVLTSVFPVGLPPPSVRTSNCPSSPST